MGALLFWLLLLLAEFLTKLQLMIGAQSFLCVGVVLETDVLFACLFTTPLIEEVVPFQLEH